MDLKENAVFVFCEGTLTIRRKGHGEGNGWAVLSIPENQIEYDDGHATVEIAPSELRELRDWLNKMHSTD